MLVRNPKKRPSASKMLSVRTAHTLLLSVKMRNDDKCIRTLFLLLLSPSGQKISYCRIKTTFSLLVLWNLRLTVTTSRLVSVFILDRTNLYWLSLSLSLSFIPLLPASPLFLCAAHVFDPAVPETGADPGPAGKVSKPWETEELPDDGGRRDGGRSRCSRVAWNFACCMTLNESCCLDDSRWRCRDL